MWLFLTPPPPPRPPSTVTAQCSVIAGIFNRIVKRVLSKHTGVRDVLASVTTLIELVNDPELLQPTHVVENMDRTHAYKNGWSSNPKTLSDIDTHASAGGYIYGVKVRSELYAIPEFREANGSWIAAGLKRLQVKYAAQTPHGTLLIPAEMAEALSHLHVLFSKWK